MHTLHVLDVSQIVMKKFIIKEQSLQIGGKIDPLMVNTIYKLKVN